MQRQRRARMVRIDYMPGKAAMDAIEAMRAQSRPGTASATNSAVIDAIVAEWARLTGLKKSEVDKPMTPAISPDIADQYARARMTSDAVNSTRVRLSSDNLAKCAGASAGTSPAPPELPVASQARGCTTDFDPRHAKPTHSPTPDTPEFLTAFTCSNESGLCHAIRAGAHANNSGSLPAGANRARVICGARRRRDGQPCQGMSVPGKQRCKWHGGASTGPRTDAGRARAMANLRQHVLLTTKDTAALPPQPEAKLTVDITGGCTDKQKKAAHESGFCTETRPLVIAHLACHRGAHLSDGL